MFRKHGGQTASRGSYWDKDLWRIFVVQNDGEVLPGSSDRVYLRLSTIEMLVLALIISGMFVLFVPFAGIGVVTITAFIAIVSFLVQKVLCVIIRRICKAEAWVCDITRRYFCKECGNDCDDHITMTVRALLFALFYLAGALTVKYIGG